MDVNFDDNMFLVLSLKKDDQLAYSYLIDKYYRKLLVYALNLSNDKNLAEDIVQNVYLAIWEKRKKLSEDTPIKNILYKAVYNDFVNQYKKMKSMSSLELKYIQLIDLLTCSNDNQEFEEKMIILQREIKKLPPKCQQIFLLSKQEGLTNKEISEYLNISVNTVENHISKAFVTLREKTKDLAKSILFLCFGTFNCNKIFMHRRFYNLHEQGTMR